MKQPILLCLFLFQFGALSAQQDSSVQLKEINIIDYRIKNLEKTARTEIIDTSVINRITFSSLAEMLTTKSSAFIKDNGGGRLATISIRGTSASQSNISWNGLNLNTPTLGLYDLSLMPVFFTERVAIQFGGNGSLAGSDAIGGAINMSSAPAFNKGLQLRTLTSVSSFNDFEEGIKISYSNNNLSLKSAIYRHDAENNYPVEVAGKTSSYKQPHAAYFQNGLLQEVTWLKSKDLISCHLMLLNARHETPPLLSSSSKISEQVQHDNQLRLVTRWQHEGNKSGFMVSIGMLDDKIRYNDALISLSDYSSGQSYQGSAEWRYRFKKSALLLGSFYRYASAFVNSRTQLFTQGYPSRHQLVQSALYINYQLPREKSLTQFSLRYDPSIKNDVPVIPSIGFLYKISKSIKVNANIAGVYRNPTLNDQYWRPGGNSELKPEKGHQFDLFFNYSGATPHITSEITAGVFYLHVKDYIQWLPGSDNIYSPVNENQILNRGVELSIKESYSGKLWKASLNGVLQYTLATKDVQEKKYDTFLFKFDAPDAILRSKNENQLVYVPRLTWKINGALNYRKSTFQASTGYTGHRYITSDNAYWLKPFRFSEISITQELSFHNKRFYITAAIRNPENNNYEVIAQRPVAGTAYKLSVVFELN
jgi:vitamin B12 transporter